MSRPTINELKEPQAVEKDIENNVEPIENESS